MLERFREDLAARGLIPAGASVLLGYSGGADSTCLLHMLKSLGVEVSAGHLHHGQRPEADEELRRCEAFCEELGVPFVSGRADVPRLAKELKIGLEEAGREARYHFLGSAAYRLGCDLIATAHTREDLVETVLLNLARGCGLHGLAGIPARRDNIVRPLLGFSREETRAYCRTHGLWFHDDPANDDLSFSRARIRHRVVGELRQINPAFDLAVERTAERVGEEDRFLNGMAAAALEQCEKPLNGALRFLTLDCEVAFDRDRLTALPPVLFNRGIRLAVAALGSSLDSAQTSAIASGVGSSVRGAVTSDEGKVTVEWSPGTIHIRRLESSAPFRQPLTAPGETLCDELGWSIVAVPIKTAVPRERTDLEVDVDLARVKGNLHFHSVQPGDKIQPAGFDGHRSVSTLLSDAKLTRAARARLPIICDMLGPIWIPGVCIGSRILPCPNSANLIRLGFRSLDQGEEHNVETRTKGRT
ncbi:MAG TPA: tRNA lysidine(34) synthetase TilS [Fimbriimonadaceae bacterium]|nr:tRNA lysidine(34) synthetase TilS [Fimbriimonadaceae bacterium]